MIDLHCHTNFSDGSESVEEVLKLAEKNKLSYLSITDHNTCKAYEKMENLDIKKYYSGKIIRGIELNTVINEIGIELLGYGIDYNIINKEAKKIYLSKQQKNEKELKSLVNICKKINAKVSDKILEEYNPKEYTYASSYIHEKLRQNKENRKFFTCDESWENDMEFYRKEMSNNKSVFYINQSNIIPNIEKVINLIKDAGGLVFVPHIYVYGENSEKIFKKLTEKYINKIDGFECFYSKFTKEQTEFMIDYCKKNNLYMSGGSDYHGKIKPNISLATGIDNNLNIPENIITPWIDQKYLLIKEE